MKEVFIIIVNAGFCFLLVALWLTYRHKERLKKIKCSLEVQGLPEYCKFAIMVEEDQEYFRWSDKDFKNVEEVSQELKSLMENKNNRNIRFTVFPIYQQKNEN